MLRLRRLTGVLAAYALLAVVATSASAAPAVVIPPSLSTSGLPPTFAGISWPSAQIDLAMSMPAAVNFAGNTSDTSPWPLIWEDLGSGTPLARPPYSIFDFPAPGLYQYYCLCTGPRPRHQIYVVGPRALLTTSLLSPDNSAPPVSYLLDGSASFVTDFTAHNITKYEFDTDDDGVFEPGDANGPTKVAAFEPGDHVLRLRVTDDSVPERTHTSLLVLQVPKARAAFTPTQLPADTTPTTSDNPNAAVFAKTKIVVTAPARVRKKVLRSRGIAVSVKGAQRGDRVLVRLRLKKRAVGSKSVLSTASKVKVRLRSSRGGNRLLKPKTRSGTRIALDVTVTGSDGFTVTKTRSVRILR